MPKFDWLKAVYHMLYPAQQQAVRIWMDQHVDLNSEVTEEKLCALMIAALEAELPRRIVEIIKSEMLEAP